MPAYGHGFLQDAFVEIVEDWMNDDGPYLDFATPTTGGVYMMKRFQTWPSNENAYGLLEEKTACGLSHWSLSRKAARIYTIIIGERGFGSSIVLDIVHSSVTKTKRTELDHALTYT